MNLPSCFAETVLVGTRQCEGRAAKGDSPGREAFTVADTLDVIHHRVLGCAASHEVGVEAVQAQTCWHCLGGGRERLPNNLQQWREARNVH